MRDDRERLLDIGGYRKGDNNSVCNETAEHTRSRPAPRSLHAHACARRQGRAEGGGMPAATLKRRGLLAQTIFPGNTNIKIRRGSAYQRKIRSYLAGHVLVMGSSIRAGDASLF